MATIIEAYTAALKEFETLTTKKAVTVKNKGKEAGMAKVKLLFKDGKTIEQRIADFQKAVNDSERGIKTSDAAKKAIKNIDDTRQKLSQGLKKNIDDFKQQAITLKGVDPALDAGFEIFMKRLSALHNRVKMEADGRRVALAPVVGGTANSVDAKTKLQLKQVYLNLRKGCDESEALMKHFILKPTLANFEAAFKSMTGPRSISVAVTNWNKFVVPNLGKTSAELTRTLGADPDTLLKKIWDQTQNKSLDHWKQKLKMDQPGWEDRAKAEANETLRQVKLWRTLAENMKTLL